MALTPPPARGIVDPPRNLWKLLSSRAVSPGGALFIPD